MPYRYFLLPVLIITVLYFIWSYSSSEPNAYILIPLVVLGVGIFIFQNQINDFWYEKFRIDLDPTEKKWLSDFCPFINEMSGDSRVEFFHRLAKSVSYHEFILMGPEKVHEEIKWMVLIPAVQLKIYQFRDLYKRYARTALYAHPFMTPQSKDIKFIGCEDFIVDLANDICPQGLDGIKSWLGQTEINSSALVIYTIINKPERIIDLRPEWINQFKNIYSS